jgi:hypothetical protein
MILCDICIELAPHAGIQMLQYLSRPIYTTGMTLLKISQKVINKQWLWVKFRFICQTEQCVCLSPYFLGLGITLCSKDLLDVYCSYIVLYFLATYSMYQSPSWEANQFSATQEIPCILWNTNIHYRIDYGDYGGSILIVPNEVLGIKLWNFYF